MNKKGFTLVEILAVISILVILVIIAVPNIMKLFEKAKKESFVTNARNVYRLVSSKFTEESLKGNKIDIINSRGENKLDMNLKEDIDYCIILDNRGEVDKIAVGDSEYYIILQQINNINDINVLEVKEGNIKTLDCKKENFKIKLDCKYDGKLVQGSKYENGQFTYVYKKDFHPYVWYPISEDGWGVTVTDPNSTEPITSELCDTINGKPIVSMKNMFNNVKSTTIDVSNYDTSNVVNMENMFSCTYYDKSLCGGQTIIGLDKLDTSKVTNMSDMFYGSLASNIDLSNFDTRNVTNMSRMFYDAKTPKIDVSNFDTRKVTNMSGMFQFIKTPTLDVSNFDTSNVTDMSLMFSCYNYHKTNKYVKYVL